MTTQQLIDELKSSSGNLLSYDLDSYLGESMSDAQAVTLLNRAQAIISRYIFQVDPAIVFTPTVNSSTQNLFDTTTPVVTKKVIKVLHVVINGAPLYAPAKGGTRRVPGVYDFQDFLMQYPNWTQDAGGTPAQAVAYGEGKIILYPKPTSVFSNCYICGQYLAADLSAAALSAEPDLPPDLHPAIAYRAAVLAAEPTAATSEQMARIQRFDSKYGKLMDEIKSNNQAMYARASFAPERLFI